MLKRTLHILFSFLLALAFIAPKSVSADEPSEVTPSVSAAAATDILAIRAGGQQTCIITQAGGVQCWGNSGYLDKVNQVPTDISGLTGGVTAISVGYLHACALTSAGGVKCWGTNSSGELGDGTRTSSSLPVQVAGLTSGVTAITAGYEHTCAIHGGGVKCWGSNYRGQLGNGTNTLSATPVDVSGLASGVSAIAAGDNHTCAITGSGLKCWGENWNGELGNDTRTHSNLPVNVIGLGGGVSAVAGGGGHTCAIVNGGVKCWGYVLGVNSTVPMDVSGLTSGVTAIAASGSAGHVCAIIGSNKLYCWGKNSFGQVGDGSTVDRSAPMAVSGMYSEVFDVTTGDDHTCASFDGQVKCWGSNAYSQLANGDIVQRMIPVTAHQLSNTVASISAGSLHTCAVTSNGAAYCWGKNTNGQLGGGGQTDSSGTPMAVSGISGGVSSIAAGSGYSCVVVNGGVKCWGANNSGGLGDGTYTTRLTPVDATGLTSGVTKVVVGWDGHTCALTTSGGVKCWGNNANGQAGTGDFYNTPVDVSGVTSEIADVAAGNFQTCVLTQSGGVKCWGLIVYDGGSQQNNTPTQVSGLESGVKAIAAGFSFACAITNTNGVKCWGNNTYGQLGNGSTTPSLTPVNVSGLSSDVKAISLGANHACAITNTNGVKCWGKGANLGNGSYTNNSTPVNVSGLTSGVQAISAGSTHTCAILLNGLVKCWGFDGYGQLAIGTNPINPVPVNMTSLIPPTLEINFPVGYIGSYFTLTGANFPPSSVLSVSVNGEMLTDNLQVDETGGFIFILSTESADLGDYMVKVNETAGGGIMAAMMANPTAIFKLRDSAPLREKEGGAMTLSVPSGLAQTISFIFVPVVSNR